ncbi:MAG TPA: tripartite tricarboxylate transporter substrate binding protein [Burkholderiales bacterium]|jgi:tripartite-type tricarboxylate transporter receptor subunit TctC|nr:tripartite tricarboxylate transporter substrate binding protein [Burkholderiales bacterium]
MNLFRLQYSPLRFAAVILCAWSCSGIAADAPYPSRPVRLVVPYPPGGTTDIVARLVGQKLSKTWGREIWIDNRAGAGGNIGVDNVAHSPADGYTLLMSGVSFAINPGLYKKLPFDPLADFAPITQVASTPEILEVHPGLPVNSVKELVALARKEPGKLFYGSAGAGTTLHLSGALFNIMAGTTMTHVPYKGVSAALVDLISGQVQMIIDSQPSSLPYIKAGKLKALAVTTSRRALALPDLPTVAESGVPGYEATSWYGAFAPAGTPPEIMKKLEADFTAAIKSPDLQAELVNQGAEPIGGTRAQFAKTLKSEMAKWAKVVKVSGAQVD